MSPKTSESYFFDDSLYQLNSGLQPFGFCIVAGEEFKVLALSKNYDQFTGVDPLKVVGKKIFEAFPLISKKVVEEHFSGPFKDRPLRLRLRLNEYFYHISVRLNQNLYYFEFEGEQYLRNPLKWERVEVNFRNAYERLKYVALEENSIEFFHNVLAQELLGLLGCKEVFVIEINEMNQGLIKGHEAKNVELSTRHFRLGEEDLAPWIYGELKDKECEVCYDLDSPMVPFVGGKEFSFGHLTLCEVASVTKELYASMGATSVVTYPLTSCDHELSGVVLCIYDEKGIPTPIERHWCQLLIELYSERLAQVLEQKFERQRSELSELSKNFLYHLFDQIHSHQFVSSEQMLGPIAPGLLEHFEADGVALYFDEQLYLFGKTPGNLQTLELVDWVIQHQFEYYSHHHLSEVYPPYLTFEHRLCGLISMGLAGGESIRHEDFLFIFREELGEKQINQVLGKRSGMDQRTFHPLVKSFEKWSASVKNEAEVWSKLQGQLAKIFQNKFIDERYHVLKEENLFSEAEMKKIHKINSDLKFALDKSAIVSITDAQGVITYVNQNFCKISQFNLHELVGFDHRVINSGYHSKYFFKDMWQRIKRGEFWEGEVKNQAKDGSTYWLETKITPFLDEFKRPYQFLSISNEITEKKKFERKIIESETFLNSILHNSVSLIFAQDLNGELSFLNDRFARVLRVDRMDIIGKKSQDILPDKLVEVLREYAEKNPTKIFETTLGFKHFDLEEHVYLTNFFPLVDKEDKVFAFCGVLSDITEQKKLEQKIKSQEAGLLASSKFNALGEMAQGVAHEINNPLTVITAINRRIQREIEKPSGENNSINQAKIVEETHKINDIVMRISRIVHGLRLVAKSGEDENPIDVNLRKMVDDLYALRERKFSEKGIQFQVSIPEGTMIWAKEVQLSQAIVNLINNAYDGIDDLEEKWIKIDYELQNEQHTIRVSDSGHGLSAEVQEKLFVPFFTTKEVGKGTGLGLSLVKSMVEKNGGTIRYDEAAVHTCFIIQIPKRKP